MFFSDFAAQTALIRAENREQQQPQAADTPDGWWAETPPDPDLLAKLPKLALNPGEG